MNAFGVAFIAAHWYDFPDCKGCSLTNSLCSFPYKKAREKIAAGYDVFTSYGAEKISQLAEETRKLLKK